MVTNVIEPTDVPDPTPPPGEPAPGQTLAGEAASRAVTCPECGQPGTVTINRRASHDFCRRCDFPLFWTPSEVLLAERAGGDSLRRLPGTAGRQSVGSAACPHCAEGNLVTATTCVRCGGPMRPPVAPPPVVVAPPPPPAPVAVEPEPEEQSQAWLWIAVGALLGMLAILVYLALR